MIDTANIVGNSKEMINHFPDACIQIPDNEKKDKPTYIDLSFK
jgi:hypothetical protein